MRLGWAGLLQSVSVLRALATTPKWLGKPYKKIKVFATAGLLH